MLRSCGMEPNAQLSFADLDIARPAIGRPASSSRRQSAATNTDRAALAALETALADARASADDRPPLVLLSACLASLGAPTARLAPNAASLRKAREDWL